MDFRKHAATAVVAAIAGALAGGGVQHLAAPKPRVMVETVSVAAAKYAWPDFTMDETIAIGEAMKDPLKGMSVAIFCNDSACDALAHDIDNAMQIADVGSTLEKSVTSLGRGFYIVSALGDARASALAAAIRTATSDKLTPTVRYQADTPPGSLLVAIGARQR